MYMDSLFWYIRYINRELTKGIKTVTITSLPFALSHLQKKEYWEKVICVVWGVFFYHFCTEPLSKWDVLCRKHLPFTPETKLKIKSIRKCAQKAKTKKDIPYVVVLHTQEKIKTILRHVLIS